MRRPGRRWPKRPTPASMRGLQEALQQLYAGKAEAEHLSADRMMAMREQVRIDAEAGAQRQPELPLGVSRG